MLIKLNIIHSATITHYSWRTSLILDNTIKHQQTPSENPITHTTPISSPSHSTCNSVHTSICTQIKQPLSLTNLIVTTNTYILKPPLLFMSPVLQPKLNYNHNNSVHLLQTPFISKLSYVINLSFIQLFSLWFSTNLTHMHLKHISTKLQFYTYLNPDYVLNQLN